MPQEMMPAEFGGTAGSFKELNGEKLLNHKRFGIILPILKTQPLIWYNNTEI